MLRIKIETEGLTEKEKEKVQMAMRHMSLAVNSEEFETFVRNFSWSRQVRTGSIWRRRYFTRTLKSFSTTKLSNVEVFEKIMSGSETLSTELDNIANIHLKIDRGNKKKVLGYTYASSKWQWVYRYFFQKGNVKDISGNLFHEYLHKQGYKHDKKFTTRRPHSVPYAIGYFVRDFKA